MRPELENKLVADYPQLFRNISEGPMVSPMCFGVECGDGWYPLLDETCRLLSRHEPLSGARLVQVKEKYGTLRVYLSHQDDYADGVIDMAEALSSRTCEACGQPGKSNDSGWIMTRCEGCREA